MNRFLKLSVVPVVAMVLSAAATVLAPHAHAAPSRYEAESASCDGTIDSDHSGFSGSGFCNTSNTTGAAVELTVDSGLRGCRSAVLAADAGTGSGRPEPDGGGGNGLRAARVTARM